MGAWDVAAPYLIKGGSDLFRSLFQSRGVGQAATAQAQASQRAAQLQRQTAQDQLDFTKGQARWFRESSEADRASNYGQWLADQKNLESGGWDAAVNQRSVLGADRRNVYAQNVAQGRNVYDRWRNQQQRLGNLGQLTGAAPRQIAGWHEAPYSALDPLQRSQRAYPDYVPGSTEIPPDPALVAQAEAGRQRAIEMADAAQRARDQDEADGSYGGSRA